MFGISKNKRKKMIAEMKKKHSRGGMSRSQFRKTKKLSPGLWPK